MIQLKNVNELIAHLLRKCDQETIDLLFEGKLIPIGGEDNYTHKCSLKALKFLYSKLPKADEKILFYCSFDNSGEDNGPVDLPDWITKKEYREGVSHNAIINVEEIICKLGYYIDEEQGELLDDTSNSDGEGHAYWERLYYLKNEKFRRSQRLREIIREQPQNREFFRMYNPNSKKKKISVLN